VRLQCGVRLFRKRRNLAAVAPRRRYVQTQNAQNHFGIGGARKIISVLAGEASAAFSVAHGQPAAFDARVCVLPNEKLVVDYFRWRHEDAHRNALNAHCYWMLRKKGESVSRATDAVSGLTRAQKHDLLFENGINFNELPAWQKRGFGVYFQTTLKEGFNPQTGETVQVERPILQTDFELPLGDDYGAFVLERIGLEVV